MTYNMQAEAAQSQNDASKNYGSAPVSTLKGKVQSSSLSTMSKEVMQCPFCKFKK